MDNEPETKTNYMSQDSFSPVPPSPPKKNSFKASYLVILLLVILVLGGIIGWRSEIFHKTVSSKQTVSVNSKPNIVQVPTTQLPANIPDNFIFNEASSTVLQNFNTITASDVTGTRQFTSNVNVTDNYNHYEKTLANGGWSITDESSGTKKAFGASFIPNRELTAYVEVGPATASQYAWSLVTISFTVPK